jgi:hypothetical protein
MKRFRVSTAVLLTSFVLGPEVLVRAAAPTAAAPPTMTAPGTTRGAGGAGGGGGSSGGGPPRAAQVALPPARAVDAILADVVAAVGGAAALGRHRSLHTKMEITFRGLGITGNAEHYAAVGDKALTVTLIPNLASTREGSDGTRFWSEDPINGLRILDGIEAEQARIEVAWNGELRMKELFSKIEARNELGEDGARLECLILTPRTGPPMTNCFDARTHLMVVQRGVRSGPQGDMPVTARLSDWRQVGDVKMAYATEMQVGPLAFSGRVTSIEMDVPLDASLFAVPRVSKPAATRKADRADAPADGADGAGGGKGKARAPKKATKR